MGTNDRIILDEVLRQQRLAVAREMTEAGFFGYFVATQILKDFDPSSDEVLSGLTDGGGDGGIDAAYVLVNGEVVGDDFDPTDVRRNINVELVLIQSKREESFGEKALDALAATLRDLLAFDVAIDSLHAVYNAEIRAVFAVFRTVWQGLAARFPALSVRIVYASRGDEVHPNVRRKADALVGLVTSQFSSAKAEFEFLGAAKLLELARRSPATTFELRLAENPVSSAKAVGYVCLVRLADFYRFLCGEAGELNKVLFDSNVRDYQGSTEVNTGIQASLRDHPRDDFWWLNNGVTILASKATHSSKTLTLEDPRIVNGLQTSTEVFKYFKSLGSSADDRTILVRVVVPESDVTRDRIIKATNSQTSIPPASLRATDKVQRDIEQFLASFGFYYDRRKSLHRNEGRPLDRIVGIPALAQAVMAIVRQSPNTARARPSSLLKKNHDYQQLFDEAFPLDIYKACVLMMRAIDARLRQDSDIDTRTRTNIRYYVAMVLAARCLGVRSPTPQQVAVLASRNFAEAELKQSIEEVLRAYRSLGGTDEVAKGPALVKALLEGLAKPHQSQQ